MDEIVFFIWVFFFLVSFLAKKRKAQRQQLRRPQQGLFAQKSVSSKEVIGRREQAILGSKHYHRGKACETKALKDHTELCSKGAIEGAVKASHVKSQSLPKKSSRVKKVRALLRSEPRNAILLSEILSPKGLENF